MQDGDVNYSKYTLRELEEALSGIDRHQYPKNYANLCSAHQALSRDLPAPPETSQTAELQEPQDAWPGPRYDENGRYLPNHIPTRERLSHIFMSLLLLSYGSYGVWVNDLYIPSKRGGIHLHNSPAWLMYGAMLCACLVMFAIIVDHYDHRDNERHYRVVVKGGSFLGWTLFGISLIWGIFKP
jgi:hypothetical protein